MRASLILCLAAACASTPDAVPGGEDAAARRPDLVPVTGFGSNPGALRMYEHVPAGLSGPAPLVVALHGCTENASLYASLTEWVRLAERDRFLLVFAETDAAFGCFAWYVDAQVARDRGQALSIAQMVERARRDHDVDPARIFVTGFSAGGYMTTALLAAYPDVFAAGAVLEGGPAGCDATCMTLPQRSPAQWAAAFAAVDPGYRGPYPRLLVFHGTADVVVSFANAGELVEQWTAIHGIDALPATSELERGHVHKTFIDGGGATVLEVYELGAFGHAIAVDPGSGPDQGGKIGPFSADANLWSSSVAARFFGIAP